MMVIVGTWMLGSYAAGKAFKLVQAGTVFLALVGTTLSCINTGARVTYAMARDARAEFVNRFNGLQFARLPRQRGDMGYARCGGIVRYSGPGTGRLRHNSQTPLLRVCAAGQRVPVERADGDENLRCEGFCKSQMTLNSGLRWLRATLGCFRWNGRNSVPGCPRGHPEATLRPSGSQPVGTPKPP